MNTEIVKNYYNKIRNYKMTILDKYILSQVLAATIVCFILFVVVWIAPESLFNVVKKILSGKYTVVYGIEHLFLEIPRVLPKAIPVGILLGSIYTFNKLSKSSELTILRGIGVSFNRIMMPVIAIGMVLSIFCYIVNYKVVPMASSKLGESKGAGGHFVYILENKDKTPRQNIIVSSFSHNKANDIIVMNFSNERYTDASTFKSIIFAPVAYFKNNSWQLKNAVMYEIDEDGIYQNIEKLDEYEILTSGNKAIEVKNLMLNATRKERVFTNHQISKYSKLLKKSKFMDEYRYFKTKLYQRYLHPFTCIIFAIIGCLLGFAPPRSQRLIGFTIAVGMIFGYYITLPFFDLLAQKAVLPPIICAILPIVIFIVSIFVIKKAKDL